MLATLASLSSSAPTTVLVIGDPHFKTDNVIDTNMMTDRIVELAQQRKPTFIVCLGDVLHRHETIHVSPLERSTVFINRLRRVAPTYVLVGNHDRPNNSNFLTTEHPFNALKEWPNTIIVDRGCVDTIQGHKFIFVPYVPVGRFNEALASIFGCKQEYLDGVKVINDALQARWEQTVKLLNSGSSLSESSPERIYNLTTGLQVTSDDIEKWKNKKSEDEYYKKWFEHRFNHEYHDLTLRLLWPHLADITGVFAHQEYRDAKMGAVKSAIGDKWPSNWPFIASGHIHDYDQLAANILYVGTPVQHAFGDREDKTVSWLEWTGSLDVSNGMRSGGNPDSSQLQPHIPKQERIDLGIPKKIIVYLNCQEIATYVPPPNSEIRIVLEGTPSELKAVHKVANIKQLTAAGIKISYKDIPTTMDPSANTKGMGDGINSQKYGERLYNSIATDNDLRDLYTRLFGVVNVPIVAHPRPTVCLKIIHTTD